MTVLLCSVFSILRYKEHKPYFHQNILYLTWTRSSNLQLFRTGLSLSRSCPSFYTSLPYLTLFLPFLSFSPFPVSLFLPPYLSIYLSRTPVLLSYSEVVIYIYSQFISLEFQTLYELKLN